MMGLSAGARLGPYEILAPLGAGGMGEVYRARDTRLKREVAIKMLSDELSRDAEHLERFEREAQLLAAVNHSGIAGIYGIEESSGSRYLVLELVAGETLGERLAAGPLTLDQALDVGRQIADALAAAHEKGIVHRDLKPGNVMITPEGRVKLLDFGLAKNVPFEGMPSDSLSPTIASATRVGTILGTLAYMSPEQSRGRDLDRRTDVWSFGCVLYEMLTGRRAFDGQSPPDILVSVLEREPDWHALPRAVPESIRHLLRRCLEKDAGRRLRDAGDARLDIEEALAARKVPRGRGGRRAVILIGVLAVAAAAIVIVTRGRTPSSRPAAMPKLVQLTSAEGIEESPAFSPDGGELAYAGEEGGRRKIFVKRMSSGDERRLTSGDFDDIQPAWSRDGRSVLFVRSRERSEKLEPADVFGWYSGGDVWQVDAASGAETRLVENAFNPAVSPDGTRIAVDASWAGPRRIWTVDARGLNPQQITTDVSEAVAHLRPRWSPDGKKIVFQNQESTNFDVRVADVGTKEIVWATNDVSRDIHPVWSPSGRFIVFSTDRGGGLNLWRIPVSQQGKPFGGPQQLTTGAGQDVDSAISGDGKRVAFSILKINADLWRIPVSPETGRPVGPPEEVVATTREDSRGAWSPDGRQIAFNSDRAGDMNVWIVPATGGAARRQITKGPGGDFQPNWSQDGSTIVFFSSRSGNADIWSVDVRSGGLRQLTHNPSIQINPSFSPDGQSIAYLSDESGRFEVWVMRSDGLAPRRLTNVGAGGHFLRWTADGRSVLFRCPCSGQPRTMRVALDGGEPEATARVTGGSHISFSPDGSKILDVLAHKTIWVSPLTSAAPEKVFEFPDPDVRIDYPVWSPDGRWVLFDRFRPQGGDIWLMEGFE